MRLEEVAAHCLISSGMAKDKAMAVQVIQNEFQKEFPLRSYPDWNVEIPDSLLNNIVGNVAKNGALSVRFLIKDLEAISKRL